MKDRKGAYWEDRYHVTAVERADRLGRVAPGYVADFVGEKANPVEDTLSHAGDLLRHAGGESGSG